MYVIKMHMRVRQHLIELMKSGNYNHGCGSLCFFDGEKWCFCVMGLLAEAYQAETGKLKVVVPEPRVRADYVWVLYNDRSGMPPPKVLAWAGLSTEDARLLASTNDVSANGFWPVIRLLEEKTKRPFKMP